MLKTKTFHFEDVAVVGLVERILVAKQRDARADTRELEQEIDRHVSALYLPAPRLRQAGGLTPEEIQIVEESAK